MIVKLQTEHHLEFLSLKGGCRGSSESTLVKMSNCWKSHAAAYIVLHDYVFQTVVSDCSFVASMAISAQYERRFKQKLITRYENVGLQIYGGPGSLSHDFKIWPITFQGSGSI